VKELTEYNFIGKWRALITNRNSFHSFLFKLYCLSFPRYIPENWVGGVGETERRKKEKKKKRRFKIKLREE
jgi:hypothetical protein